MRYKRRWVHKSFFNVVPKGSLVGRERKLMSVFRYSPDGWIHIWRRGTLLLNCQWVHSHVVVWTMVSLCGSVLLRSMKNLSRPNRTDVERWESTTLTTWTYRYSFWPPEVLNSSVSVLKVWPPFLLLWCFVWAHCALSHWKLRSERFVLNGHFDLLSLYTCLLRRFALERSLDRVLLCFNSERLLLLFLSFVAFLDGFLTLCL